MTPFESALHAAVEWMANDPTRYVKALRRHQPDIRGRCLERCATWPCLQHHIATRAAELHASRRTVLDEAAEVLWDALTTVDTQPMRAQSLRRHGDVEATHPLRTVHPERQRLPIPTES